ncbi:Na+/proline symporter [Haloferula luteola]|uniref:Na+/proline symporter n=1 Tax=Haloferula luteola TaxID=595692 RepID=A0A840VCI0_9BACT|nr:sodium:solute symporter family protein [Haloferula luteola]MBB5351509.1 Na+/proline symporter [Haloferula luteola]
MQLAAIDWCIIGLYLLIALGIGIACRKRASENSEEYYLAGRKLPWWALGTSMVATTFAADTPLAITEMSRMKGIWENWFWWNWLLYGLLAVFLFSRLWRRAEVLTENELLEMRYSGRPAAFLRFFKAGYFALLYNFIVLGWVINGMSSVLTVMLGNGEPLAFEIAGWSVQWDFREVMVWVLVGISTLYALLSGFWGVVVTDVIQFFIAMAGAVVLAVVAVNQVGGIDGLMEGLDTTFAAKAQAAQVQLEASREAGATPEVVAALQGAYEQMPKSAAEAISVVPVVPTDVSWFSFEFLNSQFFQFLVLILVMWWSNHATDGGGYLIQRTMAARNERHALAANLWYNFANYALRTWPWILVALVSVVLFPDLAGHPMGEKAGYSLVMNQLLGPGLKGLLIVSFLAAFMSTVDTHLNWGSSYLVHDIYRRFVQPNRGERHYVVAGQLATVGLIVVAAVIARNMGSIEKAWKFVMAMGSGIGLVLILRWFWWRINAWSEISALAVSFLATCGFEVLAAVQTMRGGEAYVLFGRDPVIAGHPFPFHLQLLVVVGVSVVAWLGVTFATPPEPSEQLRAFYQKVRPGGWWRDLAEIGGERDREVTRHFLPNFFAGMALIWGGMFFIGYTLLKQWEWAVPSGLAMVAGFAWIWFAVLRKEAS